MVGPITLFALTTVFLLSLRYGGTPEKIIAGLLLTCDILDHLQHYVRGPTDFLSVDVGHVTLDLIKLGMALWVALRANRFWPLPVCSFQLVAVTSHFAMLTPIAGWDQAYWALYTVPLWFAIALVLIGTISHARRRQRIGAYRDWRWGLNAFSGKLIYPPRPLATA